jgi:hypothetical protein
MDVALGRLHMRLQWATLIRSGRRGVGVRSSLGSVLALGCS